MTLSQREQELIEGVAERIERRLQVQLDHASGRRLAYRPDDAAAATGIGRDAIFGAIQDGSLRSRKVGRARVVLAEDLIEWLREGVLEEEKSRGKGRAR